MLPQQTGYTHISTLELVFWLPQQINKFLTYNSTEAVETNQILIQKEVDLCLFTSAYSKIIQLKQRVLAILQLTAINMLQSLVAYAIPFIR